MKVICISDTHGLHRSLNIPEGDLLIHAGDIDPVWGSLGELVDFNDWIKTVPCDYKIVIAGNHDIPFESKPELCRQALTNAVYLENKTIEINGFKIFGSPYTVPFAGAFQKINNGWDHIPDDTDIVITHGPPATILDKTAFGDNAGDGYLYARIREIKPKLHVFGHIHESYGVFKSDFGTIFVNAALGSYRDHKPIVMEIPN